MTKSMLYRQYPFHRSKKQLIEKYGAQYFPENIMCAVNHEMANESTKVCESDEVAFFPPVTGG